jgi:8-oxo-dGTP diphosphatase
MVELKFIDVDLLHKATLAFDQKRMVFDALVHLGIAHDNGEFLECFSVDGKPLGRGVSRTEAHEEGILHGAVHTFIAKRENGELMFLLQRRAACKDSFPLALDISSAGHIEEGSDFLPTVQKELKEELGLSVPEEEFTELFSQVIHSESEFRGKRFVDREFDRVYLLWRDVAPAELKLQPSEVAEAIWLPADEILAMIREDRGNICIPEKEFSKVLAAIREKGL